MARSIEVLLAVLDEAIVILAVVGGAAYAADRLGLLTPLEAALAASPIALFLAVATAKALTAMRARPKIGAEGLVGSIGRVVEPPSGRGFFMVEVEGELWRCVLAKGGARVGKGDRVRIVGRRGLTLVAEPLDPTSS